MCNLYRKEEKDWVTKWAQDAESMINLIPAYQMNPNERVQSFATRLTVENSLFMPNGDFPLHSSPSKRS